MGFPFDSIGLFAYTCAKHHVYVFLIVALEVFFSSSVYPGCVWPFGLSF